MVHPYTEVKEGAFKVMHHGPHGVQAIMDETAKSVGKKIWRAMVKVAASGFGKGLIATAAVAIGIGALGAGFAAVAAGAAFETGLVAGAAATAKTLLLTLPGFAIMAAGGTMGAIMDVRAKQNQISAEVAQAEAAAYEATRIERQQQRTLEAQRINENLPEISHAAREMDRRNQPQHSPHLGK